MISGPWSYFFLIYTHIIDNVCTGFFIVYTKMYLGAYYMQMYDVKVFKIDVKLVQ